MTEHPPAISIEIHTGSAIQRFIPDAARLRIAVFREWPYLYEGDDAYERDYLRTYSEHPASLFVVAKAGQAVVGISTGISLTAASGHPPRRLLCCGPFAGSSLPPGRLCPAG